jgi:hypothetical protein
VIRVRAPDGKITTRPERADLEDELNPVRNGLPFDLGPDGAGRPSIAVGACTRVPEPCAVRIGRLPSLPSRMVSRTGQREPPSGVTLWRGTLAWVDDRGDVRVRPRPGAAPRTVAPWPGIDDADVTALELRGTQLASVSEEVTSRYGGNARFRIGMLDLRTGQRATFGAVTAGESGQDILGPAWVTPRTLGWLVSCTGDAAGCDARFGFYRRDLPTGRMAFAADRRPHEGWARVGRRAVVVAPARDTCVSDDAPPEACRIVRRTLKLTAPPR